VTLGTSDRADGEVWLLPHAPAVTGREFLGMVNQALPAPARQGVVSPAMLRLAAPFHRVSRQSLGILYQWSEPFVVDHAKFERAFGPVAVTLLRDAIETTVAWYRRR
jgi:nucleoside-diphosphate-sugar epimerase